VAIIGAEPGDIYAEDLLVHAECEFAVCVDIFDQYPAPYGLVRYGVAPDHPRIRGVVVALAKVLYRRGIRFFGNVKYGLDLSLAGLRQRYDAVISATGAIKEANLHIPGVNLKGPYGAVDFFSWHDGHPDVPREWPLDAKKVAVLGNGNVTLNVARTSLQNCRRLTYHRNPRECLPGTVSPVRHKCARLRQSRPCSGEVRPS